MKRILKRILTPVLIGVGVLLVLAGVMISSQPDWFAASVNLKVDQEAWANLSYEEYHATWDGKSYGGLWVPDMFETICSQAVLLPVITNLNLKVKWANELNKPGPLDNKETLRLLKDRLELKRRWSLITIRVWSPDGAEAAQIANTISKSFQMHVRERQAKASHRTLEPWQVERAKLDEKLKMAEVAARRLQAELHLTEASGPEPSLTDELIVRETNPKRRDYLFAQRNYQSLKGQLERLDRENYAMHVDDLHLSMIQILDMALPSPRPATRNGANGGLVFLAGLAMIGAGYWRGMRSDAATRQD